MKRGKRGKELNRDSLPHSHSLLGVIETLDCAEEIRQRVLRVAANEREEDPRSEQRRLGVPALLGEICPDWSAAGRQEQEQGSGEEGRPEHSDNQRRFDDTKTTVLRVGR